MAVSTRELKTLTLTLLAFITSCNASALSCIPGSQWISNCNADTETLQITMNFGLDTDFSSLANIDVSFTGTMAIQRGDPYASDPINSPGNLDRIDTEIVSMVLNGITPFVNGWQLKMGVDQGITSSQGFIQELPDNTIGLSHFDTIFEIDSSPYGVLTHDLNPTIFFEDFITGLPELGAKYNHTGSPFGTTVPLFDANNNEVLRLTDLIVTDFITAGRPHFIVDNVVVPIPPAIALFCTGIIFLSGFMRKNKR